MSSFIKRHVSVFMSICLLLGLACPPCAGALTIGEEDELGRTFMLMARRQAVIIDDPEINHYLSSLGHRVLAAFPRQPFEYHFYMIRSDVYNAFAAPAGHIFIHSGLFEALGAEEEIAGILGHEIAHVHCRHISEKIERSKKIGLVTMAGMLAGVFLGVGGAAAVGGALSVGSMAAGQSMSLAFSRENELQADQIGLRYLNDAGYSGRGLLNALRVIRSREWFGSEEVPTYLSTHPASEDRISMIGTWVAETEKVAEGLPVSTGEFLRIRARLAALYGDPGIQVRRFEAQVRENPDNLIARYGYALILSRSGYHDRAAEEIRKVISRDPLNAPYVKALGMIYYDAGQYGEARKVLETPMVGGVIDPQARLYLARSLFHTGHPDQAAARLADLENDFPEYTPIYYALAEVCEKQKRSPEADYYLGMYEFRRSEFRKARFHLEKALKSGLLDTEKQARAEKMMKSMKLVEEGGPEEKEKKAG